MSKFGKMGVPVAKAERMFITHPITLEPLVDRDGKPAYVDVYSNDSERARAYNRKSAQRRLDMRGRAVVTAVMIETEQFGLLAELTAGWYLVDLAGDPVDLAFSTLAARELYSDPEMTWLKDQVDTFAGSRANFLKPSVTSSSRPPNESSQVSES